jgi:hypothetical protein
MLELKSSFHIVNFAKWLDVGSIKGLAEARTESQHELDTLEKVDESIFRVENRIIKYFSNKEMCASRVQRAEILKSSVPKIIQDAENFYAYEYVSGEILSKCLNKVVLKQLLEWASDNFWRTSQSQIDERTFKQVCENFYLEKTKKRVSDFFAKSGYADSDQIINGVSVPKIEKMLQTLKELDFFNGVQGKVHGDFILDNLVKTDSGFTALDWRQDFGGLLEVGDIYYDLAKLNHSLTMNHEILNQGNFKLKTDGATTTIDIFRLDSFVDCSKVLQNFVDSQNLDFLRVEVLTGLIWINMSAIHPHPLDIFLFNYGKYQLWNSIELLKQSRV